MKSRLTKFTAAAIIIIACITGLIMFDKTSSIAIADVLKYLEEINTYKYNLTIHIIDNSPGNPIDQVTQNEVIVSKDYGIKLSSKSFKTNENNNIRYSESYFSLKDNSELRINHDSKKYTQVKIDDSLDKPNTDEYTDPYELVERFLSYNCKSLGVSKFNGIEAEVFQVEGETTLSGITFKSESKLYIDIKTSLPIRIEARTHSDGTFEKTDINMDTEIIFSDFQWNAPVNPSEFVPVIPDDYTPTVDLGINKEKEDTIIKGLKLHAELFGNYPEELGIGKLVHKASEIMQSHTSAARKLQEQMKKLANEPEKKAQLTRERIELFNSTEQYYNMLSRMDKDPEYFGKTVSPADTDKILMQWKISDDNYRVIFGDLRAETIPSETLVRLEQDLPKE